ncbi:unnamed protein product [Urochloa humidicola]
MAAAATTHCSPKRRRLSPSPTPTASPLDALVDKLLFLILDRVAAANSQPTRAQVLRACHAAELRHRRILRLLRAEPSAATSAHGRRRDGRRLFRAWEGPGRPPPLPPLGGWRASPSCRRRLRVGGAGMGPAARARGTKRGQAGRCRSRAWEAGG